MREARLISVVIPLFNEQDNVLHLLRAIRRALSGYDYEVVAVDDGSSDNTVQMLRQDLDDRLSIVVMMRNYGQTSAMAAGIASATGKYIVTIDGDLQNDPEDIIRLLARAVQGNWDVVAGYRANRLDGWLFRKLPSRIANKIIRTLTGVHLKDYGCTLKIFKNEIAQNLGLYGELHRFIPVLADIMGARITEMPVRHHKRLFGKSKYGLGRTMKVVSDLFLMLYMQRWMKKPMHLFGTVGGTAVLAGLFLILSQIASQIFARDFEKLWVVTGLMLLLAGIFIILMGFFAEIQMRIYYEGSAKTPYLIRKILQQKESAISEDLSI
ncbi:glycosyltransferase family 2 protein [Dyadobacter pollutisoli]|jgi:glycosyltransferase involved in cell wall biosynthesis|uniref:Glycosyltransferase family 2 protein n=1 Tax=Dyadobacter pollutisoli TaxID=2910158 RepID=A0A9E8NCA3_9BACT|nr:glycosyltransferase family 2 protein [Dyadobacter pollutisoli]WAC12673.1 glycosyltransferase family 2 protein [Dyadobacter pollutisoli]